MSRIGRAPVIVPSNVTIDFTTNSEIIVTGPKGSLKQWFDGSCINLEKSTLDGNTVILVTRNSDQKEVRSKHGLYRALIHNMIVGVTDGFSKTLIVQGVGYKVATEGNKIVMNIGFSHPVNFVVPDGIKASCPDANTIKIEGFDKDKVGQCASDIKAIKPIEPYHAYGIHYSDEVVIKKEIKKATKKK